MAGRSVICECARIQDPELATIDQLARLALAARRGGGRLHLRNANAAMMMLIDLAGLAEVLEALPLCVEVEGQPEEGEQPGGVEEEGELTDPPL
jgi:hypothetical protein